MKVYFINEESGEHDDFHVCTVCVCLDKEKAEKRIAEFIAGDQKEKEKYEKENLYYPESIYYIVEMDTWD